MISEEIRRFIKGTSLAVVASADAEGHPHLVLGGNISVLDDGHLAFENWFCPTTLGNVELNPHIAVAVLAPAAGIGYQFIGHVVLGFDVAMLDGYAPGAEAPGEPQSLTRLVMKIEHVLAFCAGIHTDQPLGS
jgi:uncharacterized protein